MRDQLLVATKSVLRLALLFAILVAVRLPVDRVSVIAGAATGVRRCEVLLVVVGSVRSVIPKTKSRSL